MENITQKACKYILGVLAGFLGIDNADRAGIFKNATLEDYEKRQKFGDCGMYLVLNILRRDVWTLKFMQHNKIGRGSSYELILWTYYRICFCKET